MNYTKPMIELVYEIRRMVPSEMKPGVKLANPELFDELAKHYHNGAKTITKALIKELLHLAGDPWTDLLQSPQVVSAEKQRNSTFSYRGVVSLEEKQPKNETSSEVKKPTSPTTSSKKRVYRGQVIA